MKSQRAGRGTSRFLLPERPGEGPAPPFGVFLGDLRGAVGPTPCAEFVAACRVPALVEVPDELALEREPIACDGDDGELRRRVAARLSALRASRGAGDLKVSFFPEGRTEVALGGDWRAADVVLPPGEVAARHALLLERGGGWRAMDLESPGTWLEGRRLPVGIPLPLRGGQLLRLGGYRVLFLTPPLLHALAADVPAAPGWQRALESLPAGGAPVRRLAAVTAGASREALLEAGLPPFLLEVPVDLPAPAPAEGPDGRTAVISPDQLRALRRSRRLSGSRLFRVAAPDGGRVTIGRRVPCSIAPGGSSVSQLHAALVTRGERWALVDLESRNGTYLDGRRLPPGIATPLRAGCTLGFGSFRALFLYPEQLHELLRALRPPAAGGEVPLATRAAGTKT